MTVTFAPASTSTRSASALPVRAAVISAVSPAGVSGSFASAPAFSSRSIIDALPLIAASCSGVTPSRARAPARYGRWRAPRDGDP